MSDVVLVTKNLYYQYPSRNNFALEDINLTIRKGEFLAIIGQNGSGKTTLIKHFNGLLKPTSGKVIVSGSETTEKPTSELARLVGYVFQNPDHQIFAELVRDEIRFGPKNLGFSEERIEQTAARVMEDMNLVGLEDEMPFQLSRGQRQRLAVASVLAMEPEILIIDEPTTGQDWKESMALMNLVKQLNDKGHTCILTTHNMNLVSLYAKRVVVMRESRICMDGPTQEVFKDLEELACSNIKPPEVYRLANAVLPDFNPDHPITPQDLAGMLAEQASKEN